MTDSQEKLNPSQAEFTSKYSSFITEERLHEKLITLENNLDTSIQDVKQSFKNDIREAEIKVSKDRSSLISIFGIFASITTFLLIQIQILKSIESFWRLMGVSSFLLGSMLTFILLLQYVVKSWIEDKSSISWKELLSIVNWKLNLSILIVLFVICVSFLFSIFAFTKSDQKNTDQSSKINALSQKIQLIEQSMSNKQLVKNK